MPTSKPSVLQHSPTNDSFPTPLHTSDLQKAPSIISSRMTDIVSQDGDEYHPEGAAITGRTATGLSSGRPLNDSSRPPSAMSSQTRPSTRSPPSRRGVPVAGGWKSGGMFGGVGGTMANTSRPPSATSRISRTHVPSLASHAFFHPMSSQRLQAQRRGRPPNTGQSVVGTDGYSEVGSHTNRSSDGSNTTAQRGPPVHQAIDVPPPSRETEFSDYDDRGMIDVSPNKNTSVRGVGESRRTAHNRPGDPRSNKLNLGQNHNAGTTTPPPMQKSPRSFRANFLLPAKSNGSEPNVTYGHERHSSSETAPRKRQAKGLHRATPQTGINYQYFSGNTVFCLGGRLQNTRDRPVNIATGFIVVTPSVLFLAYS